MNKENTEILLDRFPDLYRGRAKPITQSLMAFGFECADGWFDLLIELSEKIDQIAKSGEVSDNEYPEVMQVKEKYGGLRFYTGGISEKIADEVFAVIDEYEKKSQKTCELCGQPGKIEAKNGWFSCQCDTCRAQIEREHAGYT